jgi:hypothetical protein
MFHILKILDLSVIRAKIELSAMLQKMMNLLLTKFNACVNQM